jgi:hypothetical protein
MFATILKMLTNNVGSTPKNVDEKIFATFWKMLMEKYWQQFKK